MDSPAIGANICESSACVRVLCACVRVCMHDDTNQLLKAVIVSQMELLTIPRWKRERRGEGEKRGEEKERGRDNDTGTAIQMVH